MAVGSQAKLSAVVLMSLPPLRSMGQSLTEASPVRVLLLTTYYNDQMQ